MIDFALTAEQGARRDAARRFVREEIDPRRDALDDDDRFPGEIFARAHSAGLMNGQLPTALGGRALSLLDIAIDAEEIAYGDLGIATSLFVDLLVTAPLLRFGSEDLQRRWLPRLVERARFCSFAWTEPEGSTSLLSRPARTTAERAEGGYRLNGEKCFITNAPVADFFLVFANAVPGPGALTGFVVAGDAAGVEVTRPYRKMGQRASATGGIVFRDVFVPQQDRVGEEGHGPRLALAGMSRSRAIVGAMGVGVARAARDRVVEYGHTRRTGNGQPLILQQDYRFRLAEMDALIETARVLVWRACWEADHGEELPRYSSSAKWFCADVATRVTSTAVEMLGGTGYMQHGEVEKLMRDAKLLEIYEGPPAIQKMMIAEYAAKFPRSRDRSG